MAMELSEQALWKIEEAKKTVCWAPILLCSTRLISARVLITATWLPYFNWSIRRCKFAWRCFVSLTCILTLNYYLYEWIRLLWYQNMLLCQINFSSRFNLSIHFIRTCGQPWSVVSILNPHYITESPVRADVLIMKCNVQIIPQCHSIYLAIEIWDYDFPFYLRAAHPSHIRFYMTNCDDEDREYRHITENADQ